jgi:transposase InsO family protein
VPGHVRSDNGPEFIAKAVRECLAEAKVIIEAWRRYYNTGRPHSSLGYRPPAPEAIIWPQQPPGSVPSSAQAMAEKPVMH